MRYRSVCSGIEAASVAWEPLGWTPVAFAEIEAFPRAVLAARFPGVPLHGDFTTVQGDEYGQRYRSLGNSFAVPVVRWIGRRIAQVSQ